VERSAFLQHTVIGSYHLALARRKDKNSTAKNSTANGSLTEAMPFGPCCMKDAGIYKNTESHPDMFESFQRRAG